jgi:HlyD family secretion protein
MLSRRPAARTGATTTGIVSLIAVIALVGGVTWLVLSRRNAPQNKAVSSPVSVQVAAVVEGDLDQWVSVVGSLAARQELVVAAEGQGGRISELPVDVGATVTAGQVVVQLDPAGAKTAQAQAAATLLRSQAAVRQQEALIGEARAARDEAQSALHRVESLAAGVVTDETVEQRRTALLTATARSEAAEQALQLARAEVNQAEAQVSEAALALQRTTLRAPAAGVIFARPARLGAVVPSGEVLLRLVQDGESEFVAELTEDLLAAVKVGQRVELEAGGVTGSGTVRRVDPAVDPATRIGTARVALSGADAALRPGLSARGRILVATGHGPLVPASALLHDGVATVVLVVTEGHARRREVSGLMRAGERVLIAKGLSVGERIIVRSPNFVPDGESVNPVEAASPTSVTSAVSPAASH